MRRAEIEPLLPAVFRRTLRPGSPLDALLAVMSGLHAPAEEVLAALDAAFDPRRAEDAMVPFLARWVDLERLLDDGSGRDTRGSLPTGLGRLRELVAAAARLSQWRGTARGLILFLETATGVPGFAVDELVPGPGGLPRPFHIRVRVPAGAAPWRALIERIVAMEKPAYVTSELEIEAT